MTRKSEALLNIAALVLLSLTPVLSTAQSVTLTASRQTAVLPDGTTVPMWGWSCGAAATPSAATCSAMNGSPQLGGTAWQPPLISVATGSGLSITLNNSLPVPTSLVIIGQLGTGNNGVGNPVRESTPRDHPAQSITTWPVAATGATFTPPAQALRAQSFAQEAGARTGTQTYSWAKLRPGTYLIETGTHPSIQGAMGLYGVLVVTTPPVVAAGVLTPGCAYTNAGNCIPATKYDADVAILLSEIDPSQNAAVDAAVQTAGFAETTKWTPACGSAHTCYPPAVDYIPIDYLVNGIAYNKNAPLASALPVPPSVSTGNVLLRFVNAGLRMHVPAAVGLSMSLVAEDGNPLPEIMVALSAKVSQPSLKIQNEVFLAAGKSEDVFVQPATATTATPAVTSYSPAAYALFDRQLSLSTNNQRDGGMQAMLQVAGGSIASSTAVVNPDSYGYVPGVPLVVNDPGKGLIANDVNVYGVQLVPGSAPAHGTLVLNTNGTFTYTPTCATGTCPVDSFSYYANGNTLLTTTVSLGLAVVESSSGITANPDHYTSTVSSLLRVPAPGVLLNDVDAKGYPLTAVFGTRTSGSCTVKLNPDGSFTATSTVAQTCVFSYLAQNSQKTKSGTTTATLVFPAGSGLAVTVQDAKTKVGIADYKWIIEQDLTFHIDPNKQVNTGSLVATLGVNFHTSNMPVIATGCTGPKSCGQGQTVYDPVTQGHPAATCDISGTCVPGAALSISWPRDTKLSALNPDGTKASYYLSVLPGDSADPYLSTGGAPGHTMGGTTVAAGQTSVLVNVEPNPLPTSTVTVYVFEDDYPLNGEPDSGGGVDTLANQEPSLGDFQVELWDDAGSSGDATGQMTYDMSNNPLTNSLSGTMDPATKLNACPISASATVGVIIVCPKYESDNKTLSPLTGQAVIRGLMPGRYGIIVHPGAARTARGEEWLQTNTLDGTHFQDSFIRAGEPAYFQEFGPGGYHVFMGMANPAIINARLAPLCVNNATCNNTLKGQVSNLHESRPPDESLSDSSVFPQGDAKNNKVLSHTTCYASLGDPDGATFSFTKCDQNGNFTFTGMPDGDYALVVFDQWLDLIVDGSSKSVSLRGGKTVNVDYAAFTWQTHIWSNSYLDTNGNGIQDPGEIGLIQVPTRIRFRNGKFNNTLFSDINGLAHFNETFPLFSWYVVESDTTRFKGTGVHVVYDAGGQNDGPAPNGNGNGGTYQGILNSTEKFPLPQSLRVPGAVYCNTSDCTGLSILNPGTSPGGSTARIDPGSTLSEGLQGFLGQTQILDWGKQPYVQHENGGIRGHVVYASTRPFDDPTLLFQNLWEPLVPRVKMNLYQESTAPDGTSALTLIDSTATSSWDDWAQGVRADGTPNMNCPGQDPLDPFFNYTLTGSKNYLNPNTTLPAKSQYKCYDGMHAFNQVQPAPYDGMYLFPSASYVAAHPLTAAQQTAGQTLVSLPMGKYVVEAVTPQGFEVVKEEDKNILIGDAYVAPVNPQFGTMSNIFIVPDQASMNSYNGAYGTGGGATDPTTNLGRSGVGSGAGPGGLIVGPAACVGTVRIVPDFMSISPGSGLVAPFAGASRPLCDRKELLLEDQMQAQTDFFVFTTTPAAAHYTGFILDDFSSEFDASAPTFGEKFAVPTVPISIKDFNGVETSRTYSDQWGIYNGLTYSTWDVNPPNPTGYAPNMMITCMNDPGPIVTNGVTAKDPLYNPAYSNFCYENPFMPADTAYLDTPVVPVSAFAEGYNPPDCAYPDATPGVKEVDGDGVGPWVSAPNKTLSITALGDEIVPNHAYSGPAASTAPFNQKFITRHYGFGGTRGSGTVTIGGITAHVVSWNDSQIKVIVPDGVPVCTLQQIGYDTPGKRAHCGELSITAGNGKASIDTVMVTIGGKAPTLVAPGTTIQSAIDAATPGDLIIVKPGTYNEFLLMWKPVRLQGVGALSSIVDANTHPSGVVLEPWRRQVNCLFGLALNGTSITSTNPYDPSTSNPFTCSSAMQGAIDPIPLEATVGWDATLNGNLAELLQEPTLMGAYEGAAITVLGKGVSNPAAVALGTAPILLTNSAADCSAYPSNFLCNPSLIDGMSFTDSSQGGGGIFVHGWNHNLEISNNRIHANGGTLTGGITVGQSEVTDGTIATDGTTQLPYLYNTNVNIHHNSITMNAAYGDELNSTTPASAGGVTFCPGADYYNFNYNWVCGNLSSGDGGGFSHLGFSYNATIAHNSFLFNQSFNPTITTYGGGVILAGSPPDGTICENSLTVDFDCPPQLSDGIGPNLLFNANLVMGNTAESGSGGGLRLQGVNGTDVRRSPNNSGNWYQVTITNNIISNNVAGWTGGGVSLQDAVSVNFINNTVASNDTTASAGVLFDTIGAPGANVPPPGCDPNANPNCLVNGGNAVTSSNFQPSGLSTSRHTFNLIPAFTSSTVACPPGTDPGNTHGCTQFSSPVLDNNLFWQNRAFHICIGGNCNNIPGESNVVTLTPALVQKTTGACPTGATYWDIGVYGDTAAGNHASGVQMNPLYSILDDQGGYDASNKTPTSAGLISQYCNGSRVPPEIAPTVCTSGANAPGCTGGGGSGGITVPPGVPDVNPFYPQFSLNPAATTDEGNNFINIFYGPLTLSNPTTLAGTAGHGQPLGNYALLAISPAINGIPTNAPTYGLAPRLDFFGNPRPDTAARAIDIGAVEFQGRGAGIATVSPTSLTFSNQLVGRPSPAQTVTLTNNGNTALTGITYNFTGAAAAQYRFGQGNCGQTLAANASCTLNVIFRPTAPGVNLTATLSITEIGGGSQQVSLTGTGIATADTVTPRSLAFANQQVGTISTDQLVTVLNSGTAPLTINSITIGGPNNLAFSHTSTCPIRGSGLAPGSSCTINVAFAPPSPGAKTATLNINMAAPVGTQQVALSGTGARAIVAFSAPVPAMNPTTATATTKTAVLTVTNSGNGPLTLAATNPFTISPIAFTITAAGTTCSANLVIQAGQFCKVGVQYKPPTTRPFGANGQLTLNDSGAATTTQSTTFNAN